MDDAIKSLTEWLKEKTSSSLYFTYIILVIVWNWKTFYILFFEDASLFKTPRIEYISSNLSINILSGYWWGSIVDFITNTLWHIGVPALLTFFAIRYLPIINAWAHKIESKNFFERKRAWDIEKSTYEKEYTDSLVVEAKQKEIQKEAKYSIQKSQTQEEKWDIEFLRIDDQDIQAIKAGMQAVYEKSGYFTTNAANAVNASFKYIPHGLYGRLDALSLVRVSEKNLSKIEFTEKGKYFVRKLQEQKKL